MTISWLLFHLPISTPFTDDAIINGGLAHCKDIVKLHCSRRGNNASLCIQSLSHNMVIALRKDCLERVLAFIRFFPLIIILKKAALYLGCLGMCQLTTVLVDMVRLFDSMLE